MNEDVIWKLASEGGMAALTVERLAKETGQNSLELSNLYPDPAFMVLVLMEEAHSQTMATVQPSSLPVQDRLTDLVMAHLDTCLSHRESIQKLWGDLIAMPMALLVLRPYFMKIVARILKECGMEENSLLSPLRLRAYVVLFLYVFYTWIYDTSPQQEQTLVVLDRGLKKLGDIPW